jgi:hypothetical protein
MKAQCPLDPSLENAADDQATLVLILPHKDLETSNP